MKKRLLRSVCVMLVAAMAAAALCSSASLFRAASEGVPGDVDGDRSVTNKDVVALFRYVSGADEKVDEIACDCNGDGEINNKDVALLFRCVSGADVVLYYGVPSTDEPNNIFRTWSSSLCSAFTSAKQTNVSSSENEAVFTFEKTGVITDPSVTFDISRYVKMTGRQPLKGEEGAYILLKVASTGDGFLEIFTQDPKSSDSGVSAYVPNGETRYVVVDMTGTSLVSAEELSTIKIDWSGSSTAAGAEMRISEMAFFETLTEVCDYTGMTVAEMKGEAVTSFSVPENEPEKYMTAAGAGAEFVTEDGVRAMKVTYTSSKIARVTLDLSKLAALNGGVALKSHYAAVTFKTSGFTPTVTLYSVTDMSGSSVSSGQTGYGTDNGEWQGVMFDLRKLNLRLDELKRVTIEFRSLDEDSEIYICGAVVTPLINEALEACRSTDYLLNYDEKLTDNDPLASVKLTAEHEDPKTGLWFDHSTEKTVRGVTAGTGRTGYTVRMAKNESENCQFFVSVNRDAKIRVEVEPFTNGGDSVDFELYYEFYHNIENVLTPDALPPYTGAIDVPAHTSQGFVIQLTTTPETKAGEYKSVVHVYDDETGYEIKRAPVAVRVWDFELSEKTELRTAFALWTSYLADSYNWNNVDFSYDEVLYNYFEFFLKYRINIMDIPGGMTSSYGQNWMSRDRVNTARWYNRDMSVSQDLGFTPEWTDKVLYYSVDEPKSNTDFANLIAHTEEIKRNTPDYRFVSPTDRNLDLTNDGKVTTFEEADIDQVEFMSRAVTVWCPKLNAFTSRDLRFISQVSFLQSEEQDAKYGTYTERMKKEVEEGDELWTYICVNPVEPYVNWQIQSDGTEAVVSAWQMKQLGVTGMLYWAVDYWKSAYWNQSTPWPNAAYGDGMLIYSGYAFNLPYPIASLRLESIRDGIEDYQMLCMLEETLGEEAAADMILRMTSSVVTYADNDDYVHAVRVLLGDTLEKALSESN